MDTQLDYSGKEDENFSEKQLSEGILSPTATFLEDAMSKEVEMVMDSTGNRNRE